MVHGWNNDVAADSSRFLYLRAEEVTRLLMEGKSATHQSAWDPESRHQPVYGDRGIEPKATCAFGHPPCAAAVCTCGPCSDADEVEWFLPMLPASVCTSGRATSCVTCAVASRRSICPHSD